MMARDMALDTIMQQKEQEEVMVGLYHVSSPSSHQRRRL